MITIHGLKAKRYSITGEGLAELQLQVAELNKQRAKIASEMLEIASQNGNTNDPGDSALTDARKQARELEDMLIVLKRIIAQADVIKLPTSNHQVQLGSRLLVRLNGAEHAYTIVGSIEADPVRGKISDESPLGRSLLGKKANDQFEVFVPRSRKYQQATILSIT